MNINKSLPGFLDLFKAHWSFLLIISAFVLFATKTSFNIPVYIMALIGLYRVIKNHTLAKTPEIRFIYILFFSIWLPMLFSLTDAVDLPHSLKTTLPYLRFLFAAYFVIDVIKKNNLFNQLMLGISIIISFWCLDALFQLFVGVDIFGYPECLGISGVFCPKGTLSHILAIISPVFFEIVRRNHSKHPSLWLLLLIFFCVVFLGEKRTAWIMFLSSCCVYSFYLFYLYRKTALKAFLLIAPVVAIILGLLMTQYQPLNSKVKKTLGLFSGNYEQINEATAERLPLWETGIKIYRAHWINGIGPRGFRHAYADYADADDYFLTVRHNVQTHPHLVLLEILVETGVFGFLGYLVFWFYLMRVSFSLIRDNKANHLPWLMCIMIAILPYNAGLAFYGSYWSTVTWWMILLSACFIFSDQDKRV